ncbi:PDDEXK nuclease domain-containing protein [Chryseobacterium sp. KACC 21268]|nr:PDDEXK nuclease domain-containing protein [Chryseobacterium sp. KACC 21268]
MQEISLLISKIGETQSFFKNQAQRQVNIALTLRNWLIGFYISEYELNGNDRAEYGKNLYKEIARKCRDIPGMSERNLYWFSTFYKTYQNILQSPTTKLYIVDNQLNEILQSLTAKSKELYFDSDNSYIDKLINNLSFTHIVEFLKLDDSTKRTFYEAESIKNNWSVRELQRAVNSILFERTGLSKDKLKVLEEHKKSEKPQAENFFRSPYILEFLGLKEETSYSENQLELSIINHLQTFLLEMGKGFCFEARQKRITFDNTHYYIDLVFYHRILRCNILIDLKLGEFSHADAGQMNVYLNYYNENEKNEGDNPPIGIILCANKNESLVKYATTGLSQQIFVNKYLVSLPKEEDLKRIIDKEQDKF